MSEQYGTLNESDVMLVGESKWIQPVTETLKAETDADTLNVSTAEAALEALQTHPIDCILSEVQLNHKDGLWLLSSIRKQSSNLPVVLCTAAGSEGIASDAIAHGVSDYIQLDRTDPENSDEIIERLDRAIRSAHRTATRRKRARQFDALFHDDRTATWVLDPNGSLIRVNETARTKVDGSVENLIGQPFWELAWWPDTAKFRNDLKQVVETALNGAFGSVVVTQMAGADASEILELSIKPVHDELGDLDSIVVEGVDISERVSVERDLRRSEQLHRVTLNNMTDTVLITDEAGRFTYICPNVHFIFGYTVSEIREMGSIEELLGEDLFDRSKLEDESVLKNIECVATDKAGNEHTLLVNVREVSIQDGTLLYSCRDITKRKQREQALTTLQGTARDFLYAETQQEIAQHIVDDVPDVLNTEASAVYLFDPKRNELQPAAYSTAFERLHGPLPTISVDEETIVSSSFIEDEALFFDDVHRSDRLANPASDIRSAAYIPLGDHGVFIVASTDVAQFDDVDRELVDLLAASGEAACERVRRESRLRQQDRELQQRNRQLSALNRVNEIIREIDQALVQAETRNEIEHAVCDLLTQEDRFRFAWIGVTDPASETVEPRAWAGHDRGYLDSLSIPVAEEGTEPAGRTASTRDLTLVSNVADQLRTEDWRKEALSRDYLSVMSVPLAYDDVTYGVLSVYAEVQDAFDELTQEVLIELGETIASATSAITRKNALLNPSMTRVVLEADDPSTVLYRLAKVAECTIIHQGDVQTTSEGNVMFVKFEGAPVDAVEQAAADLVAVESVSLISSHDESGVLRLQLSQPFFALGLADHGAVLRSAIADSEGMSVEIDIPEGVDVTHMARLVSDAIGNVELQSKQTIDRSESGLLPSRFFADLTDRQLEVVQTAYYSGFFESPRGSTGEDVAESLDISPQAFYQHTRTAQRKLFASLFDDIGRVVGET